MPVLAGVGDGHDVSRAVKVEPVGEELTPNEGEDEHVQGEEEPKVCDVDASPGDLGKEDAHLHPLASELEYPEEPKAPEP